MSRRHQNQALFQCGYFFFFSLYPKLSSTSGGSRNLLGQPMVVGVLLCLCYIFLLHQPTVIIPSQEILGLLPPPLSTLGMMGSRVWVPVGGSQGRCLKPLAAGMHQCCLTAQNGIQGNEEKRRGSRSQSKQIATERQGGSPLGFLNGSSCPGHRIFVSESYQFDNQVLCICMICETSLFEKCVRILVFRFIFHTFSNE